MSTGNTEVILQLHQRQYDALQRVLKNSKTALETVMQARIEEFYQQTVPDHEQQEISLEIEAERLAEEDRQAGDTKISVFHIAEDGEDNYFLTTRPVSFLKLSFVFRRYVRQESLFSDPRFLECFYPDMQLKEDQFQDLAEKRLNGSWRIFSVFDVDFGQRMISTMEVKNGWQTHKMEDILTAAGHASQINCRSEEHQWSEFLRHLSGQMIEQTPSGPMMQTL